MFDDNIIKNALDQYTMRTLNQIETYNFYKYVIKYTTLKDKADYKKYLPSVSSLIRNYGIESTHQSRIDMYNDRIKPYLSENYDKLSHKYEIDFVDLDFEQKVLDFYNTYLVKCQNKEEKIDLCQHLLKYLVSKNYELPYSKYLIRDIDAHTREIVLIHQRDNHRYVNKNPPIKMIAYFNGNYLG